MRIIYERKHKCFYKNGVKVRVIEIHMYAHILSLYIKSSYTQETDNRQA